MSYTIGTFIYGVVDTPALEAVLKTTYTGDRDYIARELAGFVWKGEGNHYWFGIKLGDQITEIDDVILADIPTVTPAAVAAFAEKRSKLPQAIQEILGEPVGRLVWDRS